MTEAEFVNVPPFGEIVGVATAAPLPDAASVFTPLVASLFTVNVPL